MAYIQTQLFSLIHHPSENGWKAQMGPIRLCVKRAQCTGGLHCWGNFARPHGYQPPSPAVDSPKALQETFAK